MDSNSPLISVITPFYKAADTLPAMLTSLLRQDERRWESIIVDDGSPDGSLAVAQSLAREDSRITLLTQSNAGACAARNTGLAKARGKYVLFLDADDSMEDGALLAMSDLAQRRGLGGVYGNFRYVRPDGIPTHWLGSYCGQTPLFEAISSSNVLSVPSCVMLRRSLLQDIGAFDMTLAHCGDWDLWSRLARSSARIECLPHCVTGYRMRPASLSRNPLTLLRDAETVLRRIHGRDPRVVFPQRRYAAGADKRQLQNRVAAFTFFSAAMCAMQGRIEAAMQTLDSIRRWPALPGQGMAEFLLHAACTHRCVPPDDLHPLPSEVRQSIDWMVNEMETRTRYYELTEEVSDALSAMGFNDDLEHARQADRARLERPRSADDTTASVYLRSLALRECV